MNRTEKFAKLKKSELTGQATMELAKKVTEETPMTKTNMTEKNKTVAPAAETTIPDTLRFNKDSFPFLLTRLYRLDGYHPVSLDDLIYEDGSIVVDEGSALMEFLTLLGTPVGNEGEINWEEIAKVKVEGGMITQLYAPEIFSEDDKLFLVSGANKWYLPGSKIFTANVCSGELEGALISETVKEAEYERFFFQFSRSQYGELFNDYEIPIIFRSKEDSILPTNGTYWKLKEVSFRGLDFMTKYLVKPVYEGGTSEISKLGDLGVGEFPVAKVEERGTKDNRTVFVLRLKNGLSCWTNAALNSQLRSPAITLLINQGKAVLKISKVEFSNDGSKTYVTCAIVRTNQGFPQVEEVKELPPAPAMSTPVKVMTDKMLEEVPF